MRVFTALLLPLIFVVANAADTDDPSLGKGDLYLITTPNVYTSNQENVCILFFKNIFQTQQELNVQLKAPATTSTVFEAKKPLNSLSACVPVSLKDVNTDRVLVQVLVGTTINETRLVDVRRRSPLFNVIESSKNVYEPGEEIEFRVFSFNQWLKPVEAEFDAIWVEDSTFTSVMQWNGVISSKGILSYKVQLSEGCNDGRWKIVARMKNNQGVEKLITVNRKVKPLVKINVNNSDYILLTDEKTFVNVCIVNELGYPVKGEVDFEVGYRRALIQHIDLSLPSLTNSSQLNSDGCVQIKLLRNVLKWNEVVLNMNIRNLRIFLEFLDAETGFSESRTVEITLAEYPIQIAIPSPRLVHHYFKPGLPYFSYMMAQKPDFSPASNEEFNICVETRVIPWHPLEESNCNTAVSDEDGIVPLTIPAVNRKISQIYVRVNSVRHPEVVNTVSLEPWFTTSHQSILVKPLPNPICKGPINIEVFISNYKSAEKTLYYQFLSLDVLENPGTAKLKMDTWTQPTFGEILDQGELEEDAKLPEITRGVLSLELPASIPPYSIVNRLVLYFVDEKGNLVSDSVTFFTDCLNEANVKMSIQRSNNREVDVKVADESQDSICAVQLSANEKRKEVTKRRIMHLLETFDVVQQPNKCQQQRMAQSSRRNPYNPNFPLQTNQLLPPVINFHSAWDSFNEVGLIAVSNRLLDNSPCESHVFPQGVPEKVHREFQNHARILGRRFSKSILNREHLVKLEREVIDDLLHSSLLDTPEKKITVNYENNDKIYGDTICMSKNNGLSFAANELSGTPLKLSMDFPSRTVFGEEIPVEVVTETNGNECVAMQVEIEKSNFFSVNQLPSAQCVCNKNLVNVTLKPKAIGRLNFQLNVKPATVSNVCSGAPTSTFAPILMKKAVLVSSPGIQYKEYNTTVYCTQNKEIFFLKKSPSIKKAIMSANIISLIHLNLKDHNSDPSVIDLLASISLSASVSNSVGLKVSENMLQLLQKETAKTYQDLLNYRYPDGSFTTSRRKHFHSDIPLTAEAFKTLTELKKSNLKAVQERDLIITLSWIYRQQQRDGCFYYRPHIVNAWPVSLDSTLQTTAFVTATLLESGINATSSDQQYPLNLSYQCIKSQLLLGQYSDLTLALLAYIDALKNDATEAEQHITELLGHATHSENEIYWNGKNQKEVAGYAILTLLKLKENAKAMKIGRWLVSQPKPLQSSVSSAALIQVWTLFSESSNLKVKVNNKNLVALTNGESQNVLASPNNANVQIEGKGCALLLLDTIERFVDERQTYFNLTVTGLDNGYSSCRRRLMRLCVKEIGNERFNSSVLKVNYVSGFTVDERELIPRLATKNIITDFKIRQNHLLLYLRPFYLLRDPECFDIPFIQKQVVHNIRPAFVQAYDYYEYRVSSNHFNDVLKYSFPKECNVTRELSHTKRHQRPERVEDAVTRRMSEEALKPIEPQVFRCPQGVADTCPDCRSSHSGYNNSICTSSLAAVIDRRSRIAGYSPLMTYEHPLLKRDEDKKCVTVPLQLKKVLHLNDEGRSTIHHSETLYFFMLEHCKCEFIQDQSKEGLVVVDNGLKKFNANVNLLQLTDKDFLLNLKVAEIKFPKCD